MPTYGSQVLFIGTSYWIVWLMSKDPQISATYDSEMNVRSSPMAECSTHVQDIARLEYLVAPCVVFALITAVDWTAMEVGASALLALNPIREVVDSQ